MIYLKSVFDSNKARQNKEGRGSGGSLKTFAQNASHLMDK